MLSRQTMIETESDYTPLITFVNYIIVTVVSSLMTGVINFFVFCMECDMYCQVFVRMRKALNYSSTATKTHRFDSVCRPTLLSGEM